MRMSWTGFIVFLGFTIFLFGSDQAAAQTDEQEATKVLTLKERLSKRVTLDADDAFLPAILTILAEKSGFNIVTGPGVNKQERISVHIKDTKIDEAINLVVRAAGLSYEIVGNSFLVADAAALEREIGLAPKVYNLQYAIADEIKVLLTDLTEYVQVDTSGNRVLVLASPKVQAEILDIIKQVDVAPMQILLEARLIEVATSDLDEYGIDWAKLSSIQTIIAESPLNPDGSSRAPNVDQSGEIEKTAQKIEGFDNIGHFSRVLNAFDITLDFLLKRNKAKLLAHSKITTLNNRTASILIGETVVIPQPVYFTGGEAGTMMRQTERDSVGVKLQITPTINKHGYITVKVEPEVSSIIELVQGTYPRKKIRTASTTVLVKDGQQIFIGGLLSVDDTRSEYKMPLLSSIPLIGNLFTHTEYETKKTDLIIEITPRIIRPDISYSDAGNFTSDGYGIIGPGSMTDLKAVEPELEEIKKTGSSQDIIREFQNRVITPKKDK